MKDPAESSAGSRQQESPRGVIATSGRHPSTQQIARWFSCGHLKGDGRQVSFEVYELAEWLIDHLPDGPELTAGLRKLLEAKDCFVRAAIAGEE